MGGTSRDVEASAVFVVTRSVRAEDSVGLVSAEAGTLMPNSVNMSVS